MFRQRRIETVGTIGEFIRKETKAKAAKSLTTQAAIATLAASTLSIISKPVSYAHAETIESAGPVSDYISDQLTEKIIHAFEPLVGLVQGLSYPVAMIMLTGGALLIMIGSKDKGLSLIQHAGIGYILVQLAPLMMSLLVEVGKTVAITLPLIFI